MPQQSLLHRKDTSFLNPFCILFKVLGNFSLLSITHISKKFTQAHTHIYFPKLLLQNVYTTCHSFCVVSCFSSPNEIPCMCSLTWLILDWPDSCPDSSRVLKSFRKCQESSWRNDLMVLGTFTCHHMIIKTVGYVELASRARSVLPADLYSDYYIISINIL